jgi:hypothetical protein
MRYITVKDGKVDQQVCGPELPAGAFIVDDRFIGYKGDDVRKFDFTQGGQPRPDEELITEGLIEDIRGTWYRCGSGEPIEVTSLNYHFDEREEYTRSAPTSLFDEWDGEKWAVNETLKTLAEKQQAIDEAQDTVDKHLAEGIDNVMYFIDKKFNLDQAGIDFINNASTMAHIKAILLDRFSMTAGEVQVLQDFRDKYEAWKSLKG